MDFISFFFLLSLFLLPVSNAAGTGGESVNPFSPKAALLRYWRRTFLNDELPVFLLGKASPLNATQAAIYAHYIDTHNLQEHLPSFCASANLYCTSLKKKQKKSSAPAPDSQSFTEYSDRDFSTYIKPGNFGTSDFTNYSVRSNVAKDNFVTYDSSVVQQFTRYESEGNVGAGRFSKYDTDGVGGFNNYGDNSNVDQHRFSHYADDATSGIESFRSYTENSNVVANDFKSYGSLANGEINQFSSYSTSSNVITNKFTTYSKEGNGPLNQFTSYSDRGNVVRNQFQSYEADSNAGLEQFQTYSEKANMPENIFRSYGKGDNGGSFFFETYGNSSNPVAQFTEYGKDANGVDASFTFYGKDNTTFSDYQRTSTSFNDYRNASTGAAAALVEPGKFFRESTLVSGNRVPVPDIRDKMPPRSFLPRAIADKLPFSSRRLPELIRTLNASGLQVAMARTVADCERPAAKDETKRCVTSIEGMAEFAESMLGKKARVSTTANTAGSGRTVEVGRVDGRNGGRVTRSVSCHQSLFPYLVYYCHAVPRVKVYDVEVMLEGKKANQAVAICHLDTTQWSSGHAAFKALGHRPGEIEVCHFIFENDFIWVARD
ncbi:unnamed protein product [Victoria cruziana]